MILQEDRAGDTAKHYANQWGVQGVDCQFSRGPLNELPNSFSVLEFKPHGERNMWTYATCCMSTVDDEFPIELHVFSPQKSDEIPEILTAVGHYHRTGESLGHGHTVNFGKPWIGSSTCEYGLLSLPYLDGPDLENLRLGGQIIRCLWLIPITKAEVEYKKVHGLEALENSFEIKQFDYLDPMRESVC